MSRMIDSPARSLGEEIKPRGSEPALLRAMLDGQTASADQWAHMIRNHEPGDPPPSRGEFGHGPRYFRLESELATDFEMDDARRETLDGLTKAAGELITVQADDLETIAKRLAAAGPV
jgi:hypothetical protein